MNVLLKAESKGFAYGLDVGYEKKNEVKITLKFFVASIMRSFQWLFYEIMKTVG